MSYFTPICLRTFTLYSLYLELSQSTLDSSVDDPLLFSQSENLYIEKKKKDSKVFGGPTLPSVYTN